MNRILLLTHFGWGSTLLKGVEMIIGNVDFVDEIALKPAMTSDEYSSQVESFIEDNGKDLLIIVDMFGGTPNTVALLMARKYGIPVVCGLNAPLLLGACSMVINNSEVSVDELVNEAGSSIFNSSKKMGLNI